MNIVFDIDGTLADMTERRKHMEKTPKDWKSFNSEIGNEKVIHPIAKIAKLFFEESVPDEDKCFCDDCIRGYDFEHENTVIIVTSRSEGFRIETETWLMCHGIDYHDLIMRPMDDFRPDHEVKKQILDLLILRDQKPDIVFDDRKSVVDMWRQNGILCCQVDNFEG